MEVSLPVRKALNNVHSEGPNHCHGVSAPLAQGMEQPPHSWKLPGLHADVRMWFLISGGINICLQTLAMALRWDGCPVASGSALSLSS